MTTTEPAARPDEFVVVVKPREIIKGEGVHLNWIDVVYDLHVHDAHNDNLLVFSNQGYENRQDAVDIAFKLFGGKNARMDVHDGDGFLEETIDLRTSSI